MIFLEKTLPYSLSLVSVINSYSVIKCSLGVVFSMPYFERKLLLNVSCHWLNLKVGSNSKILKSGTTRITINNFSWKGGTTLLNCFSKCHIISDILSSEFFHSCICSHLETY